MLCSPFVFQATPLSPFTFYNCALLCFFVFLDYFEGTLFLWRDYERCGGGAGSGAVRASISESEAWSDMTHRIVSVL